MQINIAGPPGYNSARRKFGEGRPESGTGTGKNRSPVRGTAPVAGGLARAAGLFAGLGVFAARLALYLRTLSPTVLYLQDPKLLDAVMLQMQVAVLGIRTLQATRPT